MLHSFTLYQTASKVSTLQHCVISPCVNKGDDARIESNAFRVRLSGVFMETHCTWELPNMLSP